MFAARLRIPAETLLIAVQAGVHAVDVSVRNRPGAATDETTSRSELGREAVVVGPTLLGMVTGVASG